MSDVRALLRQQRAARRVDDPYAAYSNTGKLRCTVCPPGSTKGGDLVWEAHVRSSEHRQRVQQATHKASVPAAAAAGVQQNGHHKDSEGDSPREQDGDDRKGQRQPQPPQQPATSHKRKLDDDDDEDVEMEDSIRRKRSRPEMPSPSAVADKDTDDKLQPSTATTTTSNSTTHTPPSAPPPLSRRTSRTPSLGVEIQIPSRPATPAHRDGSSASTPGAQPHQQQPSTTAISSSSSSFSSTAAAAHAAPVSAGLPSRRASTVLASHPTPAFAGSAAAPAVASTISPSKPTNGASTAAPAEVDADEWAAFEAEIAAEEAPYDADAVIARPAMTAEESAQAKAAADAGNDEESRRTKADVDLEDDKEEAALALEREFDDMEELEARVRRLKNKREELLLRRQRATSQGNEGASAVKPLAGEKPAPELAKDSRSSNKENVDTTPNGQVKQDDDDDEDDDDDDDDWDGFRFRAS